MATDGPGSTKENIESTPSNDQHNPEALLLEDGETTPTAKIKITDVRAVASCTSGDSANLIIAFLLGIILLGGGYYCYQLLQHPKHVEVLAEQFVSPRIPIPVRQPLPATTSASANPKIETVVVSNDAIVTATATSGNSSVAVVNEPSKPTEVPLYTVIAGPFINTANVNQVSKTLQELGFQPYKKPGRGTVTMVRLLEGSYGMTAAKARLVVLKETVKSAFLMPNGEKTAIYLGSFQQHDRAKKYQAKLASAGIDAALVTTDVVMNGTTLVILQADQQTASEVVALISKRGINVVMEMIK